MLKTRETLEAEEIDTLAPYAQPSSASQGRVHREPQHPLRTCFQRDRARIVHSRAFRRLEYKTQVFLNGTGDHLRTRLTHTIEVASLARTVATALGLNADLAETIALAHDLGHSPFGHSGEETLNRLMAGHGGFEHNAQSLRIVTHLECKYPQFAGLNLSLEVLEGLHKHQDLHQLPHLQPPARASIPRFPLLEAQVADVCDEITYYSHDLDDGIDTGLITVEELAEIPVWQQTFDLARRHFPELQGKRLHRYAIRGLIDREVDELVRTSAGRLESADISSPDAARDHHEALIAYPQELAIQNRQLRAYLYANLYYNPAVHDANLAACRMLEEAFHDYVRDPDRMGPRAGDWVSRDGLHRAVCDYLSGMTDRYLLQAHSRLRGAGPSL